MRKWSRIVSPALLLSFFAWLAPGAVSGGSASDLRFAFLGDIHYQTPQFTTAQYLVPPVSGELHDLRPQVDFVIQTGDFFNGGREGDIVSEATFAFVNFSELMRIPFYIAKGNHDNRDVFEANALPIFSRELARRILRSYYSFDKSNCHFIMLDCTDEHLADQISWLEGDLKASRSNSAIEHIFVAGHFPLWIVARVGFTRPEFVTPVAALLAKYGVDAYFCGHTHNKTATVRLVDGRPLTQLMDAGVVEEGRMFNLAPFLHHVRAAPHDLTRPGLLPLDEGHQIFIPKSQLKYYWGYQEGSTTSYYVVTVRGRSVQMDWHVLGNGVVRSFKWDKPGRLVDLTAPRRAVKRRVTESGLHHITKAWFYAAPWTRDELVLAPLLINGVPAGTLNMGRAQMAYSPFWNEIEVPVTQSAIAAIRRDNEISITNPARGRFGLAHMFLLVQFENGTFAKSSISQKVLTSFRPEKEVVDFPPAVLVEPVSIGEPLVKSLLRLDWLFLD